MFNNHDGQARQTCHREPVPEDPYQL